MASTVAPPAAGAPDANASKPPPSPTAKKLSEKTLKARETRWDKILAWAGAFVLLVVVVGLWALSKYQLDVKTGPQGDTVVGYVLAGITLVLYGVVAAYSLRHRRRRQSAGMTRTWMEVHLAFGMVSGVAAVLHSGPHFLSAAPLHGAFLAAWLLLIVTGMFGRVLSIVLPRRLTRIEDEALLVEDVSDRQHAMRKEIEDLLQANADEKFAQFANDLAPRAIKSPQSYGKRRLKRSEVIEEVWQQSGGASALPASLHDTGKRIVTCLVEERYLGEMMFYHYILRAWVPVHVALTTLCFPWLIVHIITVFLL